MVEHIFSETGGMGGVTGFSLSSTGPSEENKKYMMT